jgi:hypothetical protein
VKQFRAAAPRTWVRALGAAAALAAAASAAGCGLGAGDAPGGVQLSVTDAFGTREVLSSARPAVSGEETVMRLLTRNARVTSRYGGGFVQSIDGRGGGQSAGRPVDWFFYVNGIESSSGAADVKVHDGDRVWWDRHDWGAAQRVPAVVGSFPEPFVHGRGGKRLPVRIECAPADSEACGDVAQRFADLGVPAARGGLGTSAAQKTLRVLVGTWTALRLDPAARLLERGPAASGVYGRPSADGHDIAVLDSRGRTVRVLHAGTGLVAATRFEDAQPAWIVSGTDTRGVASAVRALDESALTGHFALAISDERGVPLPEVSR